MLTGPRGPAAQRRGGEKSHIMRTGAAAGVVALTGTTPTDLELQLQLLTQRNQPGPAETWAQDVAQVLSGPHEEATARRLQNVLKNLLRG